MAVASHHATELPQSTNNAAAKNNFTRCSPTLPRKDSFVLVPTPLRSRGTNRAPKRWRRAFLNAEFPLVGSFIHSATRARAGAGTHLSGGCVQSVRLSRRSRASSCQAKASWMSRCRSAPSATAARFIAASASCCGSYLVHMRLTPYPADLDKRMAISSVSLRSGFLVPRAHSGATVNCVTAGARRLR